jgi:hypothetical protein
MYTTHCPQGHTVMFNDLILERSEVQQLTLGVMEPELYKKQRIKITNSTEIFCNECDKHYPLNECKK